MSGSGQCLIGVRMMYEDPK